MSGNAIAASQSTVGAEVVGVADGIEVTGATVGGEDTGARVGADVLGLNVAQPEQAKMQFSAMKTSRVFAQFSGVAMAAQS